MSSHIPNTSANKVVKPRDQSMYRNSIARCDMYSNPYDVRMASNPVLTQRRAEEYARSRDSMVSAQNKLEKELLQKLLKLPQGKFVLIGTVGKYAFLAIVLPPYIFLYGMPKWLLKTGMPLVMNMLKNRSKKIAQSIMNPLRKGIERITSPFYAAAKLIANKIERTKQQIKAFYQRVYDIATYPLRFFQSSIVKPIAGRYQKLQDGLKKISAKQRQLIDAMQKQMTKSRKALNGFIQAMINQAMNMKNAGSQLLKRLSDLKNPFKLMGNRLNRSTKRFNNFLSLITEKAEKLFDRLVNKPRKKINQILANARESVKKAYNQLSQKMAKLIEPVMNLLMHPFLNRNSWENISKKFRRDGLIEGCKQVAKECALTGKRAVKFVFKILGEFASEFGQLMPLSLAKVFSLFGKALKNLAQAPQKLIRSKGSAIQKLKSIKERIAKGFNWLSDQGKKLLTKAAAVSLKVKDAVAGYAVRAKSFISWILLICLEALRRACYILRLIMAWISILFKQGMQSVRLSAQKMFWEG